MKYGWFRWQRICLQCRRPGFNLWVRKIPRGRECSTPVFLPGKSHRQRSLASYNPWGHKRSDTTEWLTHTHVHVHTHIVDLQCCVNSCCTAKWLSYTHTHIYMYILFYIIFHYGLSQVPEYSSPCYALGPCCLSIFCSICNSLHLPAPPPVHPPWPSFSVVSYQSVLYACLSVSTSYITSIVSYFRLCIYVISYNICLSLSDILHLVWESLVASLLLQMALFHSFLCLSNIPLYICTTSYPFISQRTFTLLPYLGHCK